MGLEQAPPIPPPGQFLHTKRNKLTWKDREQARANLSEADLA